MTLLQNYLKERGIWTEGVYDSGSEGDYAIYADFHDTGYCAATDSEIRKEHHFGMWKMNGAYFVRVDGSDYAVKCPTKEDVLAAIKFGLFCFGMNDILSEIE
jgi:hypothetical protein